MNTTEKPDNSWKTCPLTANTDHSLSHKVDQCNNQLNK